MEKLFQFKDAKVEEISLSQLQLTADEENLGNKPLNGISHKDLWTKINRLMNNANLKPEIRPIWVTNGGPGNLPGITQINQIAQIKGESIESYLIRRAMGMIEVPMYKTDNFTPSIAINYHQFGIEIAYGSRVHICTNLNIYGDTYMRNYGPNSVPLDKMFDILAGWLSKIDVFSENDKKVYNRLTDIKLGKHEVLEVIGVLAKEAVTGAYIDSKLEACFNISQMTPIIKSILKHEKDDPEYDAFTAWDFMNIGTDILKPHSMDATNVFKQNNSLGNFIINRYMPEEVSYSVE